MPNEAIFLVDNGSLRAEATLCLRKVADRLAKRTRKPIEPVSVLHSNRIDCSELGSEHAEIFQTALYSRLRMGIRQFTVLPLFFGPSRALQDYLPEVFSEAQRAYPDARLTIARPLAGAGPEPDERIAEALVEHILETSSHHQLARPRVALVDHGSPLKAVTDIRDAVARQVAARLGVRCPLVQACSMERRPGPEYDFNDPLLDSVLSRAPFDRGAVVVAQLFLQPGRHAGPEGDIAQICAGAEVPGERRIFRTALLGEHPLLLDILAERLAQLSPNVSPNAAKF